jgi:hypothetical protein
VIFLDFFVYFFLSEIHWPNAMVEKDDDQPEVSLLFAVGCSAICDFLRREDELMTELMNHKRSTSY